MEAGNSLEQSVALVAAANKVVQDPNSVGSALRTISLRLRGTSVEVLEEIGEETDGVVESVSKMQEKIQALTGVNILTDSGAYKETYQILYEIGQVWKDMDDIDQAALLELMAGKNRANTLAAILGNMTDLEGAYESALNAEGSALRENEAYLDSIQGRIDLFNNTVQTMWMNFIDSEAVKFIIDLGAGLIKLVDNIGLLKTALAGVLTYFNISSKSKLDFASMFGLSNIKTSISQVNDFTSILSTIKDVKLEVDPNVNITEILDGMSKAAQNGQQALVDYTNALGPGTDAIQAYAASVQDGNYSLAGFQQFITTHNSNIKASGVAAKAAAVGHQLLNAALSMGISLIASFAIDAIVKGLDALIVTNEELIQQAEELQNAYSSQSKTIQENISTIKELENEFGSLSKGVDDYGNNISLATDDYARYKEIVETIVGISPSLIEGYDLEGNAIANKNGLLQESIRLMQEEQRLNAQKLTSDDNLETIGGSIQSRLEGYKQENPLPYGDAKYNFMTEFARAISDDDNYDVFKALNPDGYEWLDYSTGGDSVNAQNFASDFYDAIIKDLRSEESKLENYFTKEQRNNMLGYAHEYEKNVQVYNDDVEAITKELNSTLQTVPLSETAYYTLSNEMKGYLTQYINGLDVTTENLLDKKREIIEITNFISSNKDVQSILSDGFKLKSGTDKDGNKLLVKDYKKNIEEIIEDINNSEYTSEQKSTLFDFIGLNADSKEFNNEISSAITHAENLLRNEFDAHVNDLSISDILITTKITEDPDSLTFDELEQKIEDIKIATTENFDITKYTKAISNHSAVISEYQEALQKLGKGSFTMDDFVGLVEKYPDLAKGVDISSNAFYGLSRNLNRAIKANTKSFINDLQDLKLSLEAAGQSTDTIDQLITSIENMPEDALNDTIERFSTLADEIERAKLAQDRLISSMEENPNEGYETRGEAMEYIKEAMKRGEIGSESNLWNVAERYGFTYDSAKTINENADALANYIAVRDTWYKQDDDGNYTYDGTENFINSVERVVEESEVAGTRLAEILTWDYDETTGVFDFDFDNKDLPEIISLLSQTKELIGLTEQEWMDLMVQVGQYFGVDWSNYQDAKDHLDEIANSTSDAKTKVEEYGKAMQDYFGQETSIDLTKRPMVSKEDMQMAGWSEFDGEYATLFSGGYSNTDDTVSVTVTPILPDGEVLGPGALSEYANQLAEGADPAELKFEFKGKEYTGEDIFLKKTEGKDASKIDDDYGLRLSEAQAQYDQLRDRLNINTTINESGIEGLREISELQDTIQEKSDGTVAINEDSFRSSLTEAEYTNDQIDLLVEKIKTVNSEAFHIDPFKLDDTILNQGINGLKEVIEIQDAIKESSGTGLTIVDADMFASILDGAGYSEEQIDALIQKIQEYNDVVVMSGNKDPLGINATNMSIDTLRSSLETLGITYSEGLGTWFDGVTDIKINVPDLVSTLKANNWTDEAIKAYCDQLSQTNIEGFQVKVDPTEVDAAIAKANEIPEQEITQYEVTGTGADTVETINNEWDKVPTTKSTEYTITETTIKKTKEAKANGTVWWNPTTWFADGTAHAQGTAFAEGSWGAPKTETALVGELGPELLVRNGRWTTVGDNGAEFTQVKKGDIIFNHKQTQDLLSKGYVTGRAKAYASGTAFASGGGTFGRYEFDGKGGWTEYDVNNKIVDSMGDAASAISDAADDISDATDEFKEVFDWIEVRIEELDETLGLLSAKLENATYYNEKNSIINSMIGVNEAKMKNLSAGIEEYSEYASKLLAEIPAEYQEAVQDGAIAIEKFAGEADEKTLEAINNYREWAQKVADLKQQLEEVKTEIKDLAMQKFDNAYEAGDVRATVEDSQTEKLQNAVDLIEESGRIADAAYYEAMMENSNKKIEYLTEARNAMQKELDAAVESGQIERGSNEWYEMIDQMYQVDAAIDEATIELEQFQNEINDLHWERFDELINRLDYLSDETQNLIDLMDFDDVVDEEGNWTDEGITSLGLYAQQMEIAEYKAKQYGEAIDQLTADYEAGKYSESEYLEKLNELKSAQYESIEAYQDAQEAIVDLNKARIDAIKEGIEKEIDAYEELIEKKKEALDAEKDLHDFQKSVMEQQKDIADIERQIAALEGDNSASARAKRAQLQAELAEANAELEETYYDRSVSNQQEALDKELENYKEEKEKEIEELEAYLENVEQVVADSLMTVHANASTVYDTLNAKADEYDLNLSDSILEPWKDGSLAVSDYQSTFDTAMSSTMNQLEELKAKWQEVVDKMQEAANVDINNINAENADYADAKPKDEPKEKPKETPKDKPKEEEKKPSLTKGSYVEVKPGTKWYADSYGGGASGKAKSGKIKYINEKGSHPYNIDGAGWVKKKDIKGYSKGTKNLNKSGIVNIDELGEELILRAQNGRLTYLEKGSGVVPADLTANLMEWGKLDPSIMLDENRPRIDVSPEISNTEIKLDCSVGTLLHIDEFNGDNPEDIAKLVAKEFEKHTKNLNNALRRYAR